MSVEPALLPQASPPFRVRKPVPPPSRRPRPKPLGQILCEIGALSPDDHARLIALQARQDVRLADMLRIHGLVSERQIEVGLSIQFDAEIADFDRIEPDVRLIDAIGADICLREGMVPWYRSGAGVVIATSRPERFDQVRAMLPPTFGPARLAIVGEERLQDALVAARRRQLARHAEERVTPTESCRGRKRGPSLRYALAALAALAALCLVMPRVVFLTLTAWAVVTLVLNTGLKIMAARAQIRARRLETSLFASHRRATAIARLPTVSLLVPLYKERAIAGRLVERLSRLSYPRELLDICLIVEEDDTITQATLAASDLPRWMRQIVVPRSVIKTKPRAMNYALDFCRGSIIGVYDAEDAPAPDQIHTIVRRFHERGPDVACLQGVLDFYNVTQNWLSRCFTIEYATWFRVILPGMERLGLAVPLGGTTLFFRRAALEELGGWDAHNVTEDADLGIRLARHGYRTELVHTVTEEEANCRVWPWVRQRSRWLKGYAITWAVHMRDPARLWRELGPRRFFGVQLLFLGTVSGFLLAPLLWSFWAFPFGLPHPLSGVVPQAGLIALGATFVAAEVISIAVGILAVSTERHRRLRIWVPTLHIYFPLAAIAAYKAVLEVVVKPYFWDKTAHGIFHPAAGPGRITSADDRGRRRVSAG